MTSAESSRHSGTPNAEPVGPSDADFERAIVEAVMRGLDGVAKTLAATLDERRRSHDNVIGLRGARQLGP